MHISEDTQVPPDCQWMKVITFNFITPLGNKNHGLLLTPAYRLRMTSLGLEIIIKMSSSLLSFSNDASGRPEELSLKDIDVLCFIKKNSREEHPYYVIWCQCSQLENHKQWLKLRYPNIRVVDECNDPNAIRLWNRFKSEVIKKPNYYKNHFNLTEEKQELLEAVCDVTI